MAITFGFYNSLAGDRVYDAVDMSSMLKGLITDGVFEHIGTAMVPVAYSGMIIKVGIGKAWFNDTWTYNTTDLQLTVEAAHPTLGRIDSVILEIDQSLAVRTNTIRILKGTPASVPAAPTLTNTSTHFEYRIANIAVGAAVTQIVAGNITSLVGTASFPYLTPTPELIENLQTQITTINTNLSNAKYDKRGFEIIVLTNDDVLTNGDGKGNFVFTVPAEYDGWKLISPSGGVFTVSTSGTPTFQLHNITKAVDILSTLITVDINEFNSFTAATAPVVNTSNNTVNTGDRIRADCDVSGTGTKGMWVGFVLQKP